MWSDRSGERTSPTAKLGPAGTPRFTSPSPSPIRLRLTPQLFLTPQLACWLSPWPRDGWPPPRPLLPPFRLKTVAFGRGASGLSCRPASAPPPDWLITPHPTDLGLRTQPWSVVICLWALECGHLPRTCSLHVLTFVQGFPPENQSASNKCWGRGRGGLRKDRHRPRPVLRCCQGRVSIPEPLRSKLKQEGLGVAQPGDPRRTQEPGQAWASACPGLPLGRPHAPRLSPA